MGALKSVFEKHHLYVVDKAEQTKRILSDTEMLQEWEDNQLPHRKLIQELSLLCGMISHSRDQIFKKIEDENTWV